MIYLTSDLHGRYGCLMKLLDYVGFDSDDWLYILGDVIDRNENGGVDILKWLLLQPNVQLILGNHEQMLLLNRWVFEEITEKSVDSVSEDGIRALTLWDMNGGEVTMKALAKESAGTRESIYEYLLECPLMESVCVNEKNYILVHSGLGNYSKNKAFDEYTDRELLWTRPRKDTEYDAENYTVILGHTPTRYYSDCFENRIFKTPSWWDIDTGAAAENGRPMLLCLDNKKEYYIDGQGVVFER